MNLEFEQGFEKITNCNTFNKNDKNGIIFLFNFFILIILFIAICILQKEKYIYKLLILFIILLFANIYYSRIFIIIHSHLIQYIYYMHFHF